MILSPDQAGIQHVGKPLTKEEEEQMEIAEDQKRFSCTQFKITEDYSNTVTWKQKEVIKRQW